MLQLLGVRLQFLHLGALGAVGHVAPVGQLERLADGHGDVRRKLAGDEHETRVRVLRGGGGRFVVGIGVGAVDIGGSAVGAIGVLFAGLGDETVQRNDNWVILLIS